MNADCSLRALGLLRGEQVSEKRELASRASRQVVVVVAGFGFGVGVQNQGSGGRREREEMGIEHTDDLAEARSQVRVLDPTRLDQERQVR